MTTLGTAVGKSKSHKSYSLAPHKAYRQNGRKDVWTGKCSPNWAGHLFYQTFGVHTTCHCGGHWEEQKDEWAVTIATETL